MKAWVKLSMTVVLTVEGKSEDSIMDWLSETTPQEALKLANHDVEDIDYEEEILCTVLSNEKADYVIKEDYYGKRQRNTMQKL